MITCLRYPKFLFLVKTLHGNDAEMMVEEIIKAGTENATNILFRTAKVSNVYLEFESILPLFYPINQAANFSVCIWTLKVVCQVCLIYIKSSVV